jgi:HK97 family phage prohead protease
MTDTTAFRMLRPGPEVRATNGKPDTLTGHLAVFNQWARIDSVKEGRFLERIAPGAFTKTIQENRDSMRVLFQHGKDPQVADKPLGMIEALEEDDTGVRYDVPLFDTNYNRELLPGLRAGAYGSSFRFGVPKGRDEWNYSPERSEANPEGWKERTIRELRMMEFGPVTFPAYAGATAGVRSMRSITDDLLRIARMDVEDLDTLAQMIMCGKQYIDEQDEPGDQANIPVMTDILATLTKLMAYEATEDEGAEPEDEEMSSAAPRHGSGTNAPPDDAETDSHLVPGRRVSLYGVKRKEKAWQLQ